LQGKQRKHRVLFSSKYWVTPSRSNTLHSRPGGSGSLPLPDAMLVQPGLRPLPLFHHIFCSGIYSTSKG
jgi:hypothetical protein